MRIRVEVEDHLLHSLRRRGSIFPPPQRLGGEFSEHRVATFDFDIGYIAVGKHGRFCDNARLKVAISEEIRIFGLNPHKDLAPVVCGRLGKYVAGLDRQYQKHQGSEDKTLVDPDEVAECTTKIHETTP